MIDLITEYCRTKGYLLPERELRFAPPRKWRFDFAWSSLRLALEIEGGVWVKGRHSRGKGYENDCRKYNQAAAMGWRVLRATTGMVENGEVFVLLDGLLKP